MELKVEEEEGVHFIVPEGKMVAGSGDTRFREELDRLIQEEKQHIVVDFSKVPYIDSFVLGHLVHGYVALKKRGGVLKLLQPSKRIVDLLSLTRLITIFEIYKNREEVLHSRRADKSS